jgi:hypothetical protein
LRIAGEGVLEQLEPSPHHDIVIKAGSDVFSLKQLRNAIAIAETDPIAAMHAAYGRGLKEAGNVSKAT